MKKILFLFMVLSVYFAHGQGLVQPSPETYGLIRLANTSVNYYTGTPSINIPIADLPGRELKAMMSLDYNASGFKVSDLASSVGLGWNLSAGGVITRIVKGMPDDLANGYCKTSPQDNEPDLFFFNMMGRSGKFYLSASGVPVIVPYQDLVIKPAICASGSNNIWEIIDEHGIIYRFGKTTSERETVTTKLAGASANQWTYGSSWYLSEVVSPNNTDKITFSYISSSMSFKNYFFSKYEACYTDLNLKDETTTVTVNPKLLSSISTAMGNINLTWRSGREDVSSGYYLDAITVSNFQGTQVKKLRFEYSYFVSDGCSTASCKRLRLDKIYDLSPDPLYTFFYNTTVNLPATDSKNFDHWGYYNDNTVNTWLPEVYYTSSTPPQLIYSGASRQPSSTRSLANLLTMIYHRSGALQSFEYEAHMTSTGLAGGARVKKVTTSDGNGNAYSKLYNYVIDGNPNQSSGTLFYKPAYLLYNDLYTNSAKNEYQAGTIRSAQRFSSSYAQLLDVDGYHLGYSRVEEVIPGYGKTVYNFSDFIGHPDTEINPFGTSTYRGWERGNCEMIAVYDESGNLLSKTTNQFNYAIAIKQTLTGKRELRINFNCNSSSGYSQWTVPYSVISRPIVLSKTTTEAYEPGSATKKITVVDEYGYNTTTYQQTSNTRYDLNRPSIKYITETKYADHADYNLTPNSTVDCGTQFNACIIPCGQMTDPTQQQNCYMNCSNQRNSCVYAYPIVATILEMRKRHQLAVPIEINTKINESGSVSVLSAIVNIYQQTGSLINVKESYGLKQKIANSSYLISRSKPDGNFEFDTRMKRSISFDSYDATYGNLLKSTKRDGIQTENQWDSSLKLLNAVITNSAGTNPMQTSFTHRPLVGVLTETDQNSVIVMKKEYDAYGRLKLTRDNDNNILKRYKYEYGGESPGYYVKPSKTTAFKSESISFTISDIFCPIGTVQKFTWDFGDGTTLDNVQNTTHTFTAAGKYPVQVKMYTTEDAPSAKTIWMTILNPLSLSICADGPIAKNICNNSVMAYGSCTVTNNTPTSPTVFKISSASGGCDANYTYSWTYRNTSTGQIASFGSGGTTATFPTSSEGTYEVSCQVTDGCGNTTTVVGGTIAFFRSGC